MKNSKYEVESLLIISFVISLIITFNDRIGYGINYQNYDMRQEGILIFFLYFIGSIIILTFIISLVFGFILVMFNALCKTFEENNYTKKQILKKYSILCLIVMLIVSAISYFDI